MSIIFLSVLVGVNMAFSLLSFFIWMKNRSEKLYLYFSVFSIFSGLYILLTSINQQTDINIVGIVILCAAIYYGVFPWFLYEIVGWKNKNNAKIISLLFLIAFILFFIDVSFFGFPWWQIIAHIGLIGIVLVLFESCSILKKVKSPIYNYFKILVFIFSFLAVEEIVTKYSGFTFLSNYIDFILPLDLYPFIFALMIGNRLTNEVFSKAALETKLANSTIEMNKLKIKNLEKNLLEEKLKSKHQDLTDFGVKIVNNKLVLENIIDQLIQLKKEENSKSSTVDETIQFIKSQIRIENHQEKIQSNVEIVNNEFLSKLKSSYPTLTQNELKLISLLRLKLNTKEIASIKNISPDSVKVLRYRLRKKMSIPKNKNLTDFLCEIG